MSIYYCFIDWRTTSYVLHSHRGGCRDGYWPKQSISGCVMWPSRRTTRPADGAEWLRSQPAGYWSSPVWIHHRSDEHSDRLLTYGQVAPSVRRWKCVPRGLAAISLINISRRRRRRRRRRANGAQYALYSTTPMEAVSGRRHSLGAGRQSLVGANRHLPEMSWPPISCNGCVIISIIIRSITDQ